MWTDISDIYIYMVYMVNDGLMILMVASHCLGLDLALRISMR